MELQPRFQRDLSALSLLCISSAWGGLVPLSPVSTTVQSTGPLTVNLSGQLPSVTISFNVADGVALGEATDAIQRRATRIVPSSVTTAFSGAAQAFHSAQSGLAMLLVLAFFVIYVVHGILYESFIHPLTILSGLPFAAFGALLTLLIVPMVLNVYAFVGIILLVGLVKTNAIMMTTMAALLGTIPIAFSQGVESESRRPPGIAVVGGRFFSQLTTLFITPVVYTYLNRVAYRLEGVFGRRRVPNTAPIPLG